MNKTLYVRDEDAAIWDKAKKIIGDSLSTYLTNHLREVVNSHKAGEQGASRILLAYRESGIPRVKAFYGRWLISPERPFLAWQADEYGNVLKELEPDRYALAITPKNNVVVFNFGERREDGNFTWGIFHVFNTFEQANATDWVPSGLIAEAMEVLGVEIEELDI